MLQILWNDREEYETASPCEPQYSPILQKMVEADLLEVRHVDEGGRMGKRVADPHGEPLWVSVETEPTELRYFLPGPGRYAVVARDHQGRHLGRNDVFARETGQPDPWREPTVHERLKDELARERERRRAAEEETRAERAQRLEAEATLRQMTAERDRLQHDLRREKDQAGRHEKAAAAERKRCLQAEADLAAEKKRKAEQRKPGITAKELLTVGTWAVAAVYYLRKRFEFDERRRKPDEERDRAPRPSSKQGQAKPGGRPQAPGSDRTGPAESSSTDRALDTG